jgi:hypothetical protein
MWLKVEGFVGLVK